MTRRRCSLALLACLLAGGSGASARAATPLGQPGGALPSPPPQQGTPPTQQQPQQPPPPALPADVGLSNERTLTTWAHPVSVLPIYTDPEVHSHEITHTHLETEDGFSEVYLLLTSHTDATGHAWVRLRIPGRPNGRTGWVLRSALGEFHQTHWLLVISRRQRRLIAYFAGHRRFVAPVGIGKPSTPTPAGHFWIRERFRLTNHSNPYWPYALGTSDYSTLSEWPGGGVVGIHGDFGEPQLIPGDPSHGCIRMRDADIAWLAPRLTIGTPVDIA
jgi:L,D-transpeptidase catalytic domain